MKQLLLICIICFALILNFAPIGIANVKLLHTMEQQLEPNETALLVIDMQNDYLADDGKLIAKLGIRPKGYEFLENINNLVKAARKAEVTVIWVRQTHSLNDALPNFMVTNIRKIKGRAFKHEDFFVPEGATWRTGYYHKLIKRLPEESEVIKTNYGSFTNTELETLLKAKGIKTIVYAGAAIDVCILSTIIEGWHRGYYCILPTDAVFYFNEILYKELIKNHRLYFGYTPTSDEIIRVWQ
jgi:ureidoacrylate peracid hydrolase